MPKLTKSGFLEIMSCKESFWISRNKPKLLPEAGLDDFGLMLIQDGWDVENCVVRWVSSWVDADDIIFQVPFQSPDGLDVRADMIRQVGDRTIDLFELKCSSSPKGYLVDVAF